MIDRQARDRLAELIRHLADGLITNDEFEESLSCDDLRMSQDAAIWEIFAHGAWYLYDDLTTHKMTGKWKLQKQDKEIIARWILFLKTDLEYPWPRRTCLREVPWMFISFLTFGLAARIRGRLDALRCGGDRNAWPFLTQEEVQHAATGNAYLWKQNSEPALPAYRRPGPPQAEACR